MKRDKLNIEFPTLVQEWDYEKNVNMMPEDFTGGSHKDIWWKCKHGHSWQARISNRVYGNQGCPYCSGQRVVQGVTDLDTNYPELARQWDYDKNGCLTPKDVTTASKRVVWWKCDNGHSWQSNIHNRCKGNGCPYCSGRSALKGDNDLTTLFPDIAAEWDYGKNGKLLPDAVTAHSNKSVWWNAACGHGWKTAIFNRTSGHGCPYCSGRYAIQGVNDLATVNPELAEEWDYDKNDEFSPNMVKSMSSSHKFWWKCKQGHSWQASVAHRACGNGCPYCSGRYVVRGVNDLATVYPMLAAEWDYIKNGGLLPEQVKSKSGIKAWWICDKGHSWQAIIYSRANGSGCPCCANLAILAGYNDLETLRPDLAVEWDYEKNYPLQPSDFGANSKQKVWWLCGNGHSWRAVIGNRNNGSGCHICAGKHIVSGINDLATRFPEIAAQWNYKENGDLSPNSIAPHSSRMVWWKCEIGHSWLATVRNRTNGNGCPYCSGQAPLAGFNDLATKKPALVAEWDYEKNGMLTPEMVTVSSGRIVWWRCALGHSWHTSIANRHRGSSCPYCSGRKVLKGFNDLASTHPHIAAQWDNVKNGATVPTELYIGSSKRAWWKCDKGHSWHAVIRTRAKTDCPYCAGQMILEGFNDLATTNPILAMQWDCEKNGDLRPTDVSANSGAKAWWRCEHGHSWLAVIASRNHGNGCPYCIRKSMLRNSNNLKMLSPSFLDEWDYDKNTSIKPESVTILSRNRVWWKCKRGHSWKSAINDRYVGKGCPVCVGKRSFKPRLVK